MTTLMRSGRSSLIGDLDVSVVPDADLASMTWFGVGGRADLLVRPQTMDALRTLSRRCALSGVPLRILGSGANLLVSDEGVDGVVVQLNAEQFTEVTFERARDQTRLIAPAGADMARTMMLAARHGLTGLEAMAGIPASIGGAIRMHAGGRFGTIADSLETVGCIARSGTAVVYPREELQFTYRSTNIPDPVIAHATFLLRPDDPLAVRDRIKEIFAYKKSTQPLADHSAGCTFRNPVDPVSDERVPAGRLIEEAGLKGLTEGGASISHHHANFIVVRPGASAGDIITLMERVRTRVRDHCGIELEDEVVIWRKAQP